MTDVDAWRQSVSASPSSEAEEDASDWRAHATADLLASSSRKRLACLVRLQRIASQAEGSDRQTILKLLLPTVSRYVDGDSRHAALRVLRSVLERAFDGSTTGAEAFPAMVKWLSAESNKSNQTLAPATRFNVLCWACEIYDIGAKHVPDFASGSFWAPVVSAWATFLAAASAFRPSVRKAALVAARRCVRQNPKLIPDLLGTLLKGSQQNAIALGLAIDVSIRLKLQDGKQLILPHKSAILQFYVANCLSAKPTASPQSLAAFADFVRHFVDEEDLDKAVRPTLEKLFIRQPEAVLPAATSLLAAYAGSSDGLLGKLSSQLATLARSTSAVTRTEAVAFFAVLASKASDTALRQIATELAGPLKTNRTASAENRAALFAMLATCPADADIAVLALTSKEASAEAGSALARHLPAAMQQGQAIDLKNARKGALAAIGEAIWTSSTTVPASFAEALAPLLDGALKNATANPLEGYVAIALMKSGKLGHNGKDLAAVANHPGLQNLLVPGVKPSILLNDKIYRKSSGSADDIWLLRAVIATLSADAVAVSRDERIASAAAQPLLYAAVQSPHHQVRQSALTELRALVATNPELAYQTVLGGLRSSLTLPAPMSVEESEAAALQHSQRLRTVLSTLLNLPGALSDLERHTYLGRLLILASHPSLSSSKDISLWIELLLKAGVKPDELVASQLDVLLASVAADTQSALPDFSVAASRALTDLVVIAPDTLLPKLTSQITNELAPEVIAKYTEQDIAIWQSKDDSTPVVDVLAGGKNSNKAAVNGKDHALAKWDEEQRQALAKKKGNAAPQALSKADRVLVDAQLAKEREIRSTVDAAFQRLRLGLLHLQSVLNAKTVDLSPHAQDLAEAVYRLSRFSRSVHVAADLFAATLHLSAVLMPEAYDLPTPVSVATLRSLDSTVVSEDFLVEPLGVLTLRVLYRLRSVTEARTVSSSFYNAIAPLLSRIIGQGGIGLGAEQGDSKLEQLQLAVDLVASQCRAAADQHFPRLQMIGDLLGALVGYPQLSKAASNALTILGEAMELNATRLEIDALLTGAMVEEAHVRLACLQALQSLDLTDRETATELWLLCHEDDERNKKLALGIWEDNGLDVADAFLLQLRPYLSHTSAVIRSCASRAIAAATHLHPHRVGDVLAMLVDEYTEKSKELMPEYDKFGMLVEASLNREDPWRTRVAVAATMAAMADLLGAAEVDAVFDLLIHRRALGDRNPDVRAKMLEAGNTIIDVHGKEHLQRLMSVFESYLGHSTGGSIEADRITESVIILFGRLAKHLETGDARISDVVKRLLNALSTPSEDVQVAVGECLPPLIKALKEQAPDIIESLLRDTLGAVRFAERRGAAYGLAGAVKGRGIGSLKEFSIISRIREAIEDKKDSTGRQGAVFAIETLSATLGRIFEPYIIQVLPLLLQTFGDSVVDVRNATQEAARVIMGKISGHAVKLILPSLLAGLDDRQWRSKKGAIDLIGTMAYLAPRQLSISLPTILPRLTEVLTDTHAQVRSAANASLKRFGEVISNPEIQAMQSTLLDALIDPTKKTVKALDTILATSFAHFIDTSSLALVVPILERGIRDRSSETKRKSAQIVGTLATITEARDLSPYLPQLVPKVREVLVDPVPETRGTAAQALGGLVERLGEEAFPDLLASLLETLQSETTGIDQQGAAQGLAEILAGLGTDRLEDLLPDILAQTRSSRSYVREGFVSLLVFLPVTFGERFSPYLARIIEPVLAGLADESDYVREASLKAGRMIVSNHSTKAVTLLLPELEKGLFDRNHRIRHSSMQLVGELLFKVTGISGKAEMAEEDEEDVQTAQVKISLVEVLGKERRDRVLAAVFIVRQDSSGPVRQLAVNIWKALVPNTPRTVKEILAILIQIIIRQLAASGSEQRECAARALGDLCRKMGESVLVDLMPVLHRGTAADDRTRQGVQLALTEILAACSDTQIEPHEESIVEAVRTALVDSSPVVRGAAAQAFDALQQSIGPRAIDMTVPVLLETLRHPGPSADAALSALQEVMSVRADKIVPVLIPTLIKSPITAFNARALASLVGVAGNALSRRISTIVDALEHARMTQTDPEVLGEVAHATRAVLSSIKDEEGVSLAHMHLISLAKDPSAAIRAGACDMLGILVFEVDLDMSDFYVDWVRILVNLFDDRDPVVVRAAWNALGVFVGRVPKDDLENLAPPMRRTIETTGTPGVNLPGFELGLKPVLPILLQGLLAGTAEQREQSAYAMADIVERISLEALKPHVTQIVGPLIRIIAERFPAPVKAAILHSLTVIVGRVPAARPFYPQIQRTFSKNVADATSLAVRSRAAAGLGVLMAFQPRIDPLITELLTGATTSESSDVRESFMDAIAGSVRTGGKNMTPASANAILDLLKESFAKASTIKESTTAALARLFAAMLVHFAALISPLIDTEIISQGPTSQLASFCLRDSVELSPEPLYALGNAATLAAVVVKTAQIVDNPAIARPARQARDLMRTTAPFCDDEEVQSRL